MAPRIKLTQQITRARAEQITGEIAFLQLNKNDQSIEMDRQITQIREMYETGFAALDKEIREKTALLETWAANNPDEFPKNRKSIDMVHAVIGYRTGMPKLKTLLKWTWSRVLDAILAAKIDQYTVVKVTVNKDAIISEHNQLLITNDTLKPLGIEVVQDETFFVEPKLQELAAGSVKEAA